MTYLQARKRPYQQLQRLITALIVAGVIVFVCIQLFVPHAIPSIVSALSRPFWRVTFSLEAGQLKSPEALLADNQSLSRQLADVQVRLDTVRAVELENEELKTLLGRGADISSGTTSISSNKHSKVGSPAADELTLAAVLKRPPLAAYDELVLDIGRNYGLSTSSLVYAEGGVLIGKVVDVLATTAKAKLFSSPGQTYDVLIGPHHAPATAVGRGGGQYEAQISRDTVINEGDFVLNASISDKPFGIVSAVLQDPTQPFETVLFAPPTNIYELRWVLVRK